MMQSYMRKNIFNTIITHCQQQEDRSLSKRNKSFISSFQQVSAMAPQQLTFSQESPPFNRYRKQRIQAKLRKFKANKASTELCQQNLNIYSSLKKQLTQRKIETTHQSICHSHRPSINIPEIGIVPTERPKFKKHFRTRNQYKCKTEANRSQVNTPNKSTRRPQLHSLQICSLKKYNQCSLGEIVEDASVQKELHFLLKLSEFRSRKMSEKDSRRPSDDYSVSGW